MTSKEAAFQTRRYGWNGNLEISVLSNFTDLVIYDTSVRPEENDNLRLHKLLISISRNMWINLMKYPDYFRMRL